MIRTLLSIIGIFNFCDWIVALFIAGTAWRIEGKDGRRTFLAVGLSVFFASYGVVRLLEFINYVSYQDDFARILAIVPSGYTTIAALISALKTLTLVFCWFAVSLEKRERKGMLSGNTIRNKLMKWLERLR